MSRCRDRWSIRCSSLRIRSRIRRRPTSSTVSPGPLAPIPAAHAREPLVFLAQTWQRVLELGKLHLQLAVTARRSLGEDIENQLSPVDRLESGRIFEGPRLGGLEVDIENGDRRTLAHAVENDLGEFAASHHRSRVDSLSTLPNGAGDLDTGRAHELESLLEVVIVRTDRNDECTLSLSAAGASANEAGVFGLESLDRLVEGKVELKHGGSLDPHKGVDFGLGLGRLGGDTFGWRQMGQLDATRLAVRLDLDHRHQVESQAERGR